jgi:hypothetical protein
MGVLYDDGLIEPRLINLIFIPLFHGLQPYMVLNMPYLESEGIS